jgi:hypothetical protein
MKKGLNMKKLLGATLALAFVACPAQAQDFHSVAPALEKYQQERLFGEV